MRFLVETNSKKEEYERIIKEVFPHIRPADFDTFIDKNKAGIIVLDKDKFLEKLDKINSLSVREEPNFVVVVVSKDGLPIHDIPDVYVVPEFNIDVMEKVKSRILEKMVKLTRERIKNRQREDLKDYESMGLGILIVDDEEKIVYANDLLLNFLQNKYTLEEILNLNVHEFLREIAPGFDSQELFSGGYMTTRGIKIALPDGTVLQRSVSIIPRIRADNKRDGFIIVFYEPFTSEAEELLEKLNSLIEELQSFGAQSKGEFLAPLTDILKKFSGILNLRSLLFVPFYIARHWKFEDEIPFIFVHRTVNGDYKSRIIYGFKASDKEKKKCIDGYKAENFLSLYRNFDDIETAKTLYSITEFLKGLRETTYGVLCADRPDILDVQERYMIKFFAKSLRDLIELSILSPEKYIENLADELSLSHGDAGVAAVDREGEILYVNEKFGKIFNVPIDEVQDAHLEIIPGLRDNQKVVDKVFEYIRNNRPARLDKWIRLPIGEEKYLIISGIPVNIFNISVYVWIFEDRTKEKLNELRNFYLRKILEASVELAETIGTHWDKHPWESTYRFYDYVLEKLVDRLNFSDGMIAVPSDPETDHRYCQISSNLESVDGLCKFVEILNGFGASSNDVLLININEIQEAEALRQKKFEWALRIPIHSLVETGENIGVIVMLAKGEGEFHRFVQAISVLEDDPIKEEVENVFQHLAKTVAEHVETFHKALAASEVERLFEEFYKRSKDIFILTNEDHRIIIANNQAKNLFQRKELEGEDVINILHEAVKEKDKESIEALFDLEEEEEGTDIVTVDLRGEETWLKLVVKKIKVGDSHEYIVIGHDVSEIYKKQLSRNRAIIGLITMLLNIIAEKSPIVARHSINVAIIVKKMLEVMERDGFSEDDFIQSSDRLCLVTGAILHDIGKIKIPSSFLIRPPETMEKDSLDWEYYEKHPIFGFDLLKNLGLPCGGSIPRWVKEHHERIDGSGFPQKLAGGQISLGARIIGVADEIENNIIKKPQRTAGDLEDLLREMMQSGKYDTKVLNIADKAFKERTDEFLMYLNSTVRYEKRQADMREVVDELLGSLLEEE